MRGGSPFADLIAGIQTNLDTPLDVQSLAERAGLSQRTFHRKFRAVTGRTSARFVETARLDAARMLLSRGLTLRLVAAQVGLAPSHSPGGSVRTSFRHSTPAIPRHAR